MCMNHALSFCDSCSFTYSLKVSVPQGSIFGLPVFLLCLLWVTSLKWIHSVATCAVISLAHPSAELQTQVPNYWVCPLGHPIGNPKATCLSCIPLQSGPPPVSLSWWLAPLPSGPPKSEVTGSHHSLLPLIFSPPSFLFLTAIHFLLSFTTAPALFCFMQGYCKSLLISSLTLPPSSGPISIHLLHCCYSTHVVPCLEPIIEYRASTLSWPTGS